MKEISKTAMIEQTLVEKYHQEPKNEDTFDVIIIGAGPAGMSAAVCAGRARLKTLLIEKMIPGGQASTAYKITNYLGFPNGVLGDQLSRQMEAHMAQYPLVHSREIVEDIQDSNGTLKTVRTDTGSVYQTKTIIIATGLEPKLLGKPYETNFLGRGVSFYAQSDAASYTGKDVAVIGGGNCACYAADFLSGYANHLYLIHRSDSLKAVKDLKEKVMNNPKITIIWDTDVPEVFGIDKIEKIKLRHNRTDQETWLDVKGVFVYVGRIPPANVLHLNVQTDEKGFILTDEYMRTSIRGIYAAGDIRSKQIRQIATAVSDGMIAAINAERDMDR